MPPVRRVSTNGRSPLVNKQSQITTFFSPGAAKTPKQSPSPSPSPTPTPNPNPNPNSSKEKRKKAPLLIPSPAIANPKTPPTPKPKVSDSIGKRVRVFWPLDEAWYEGRVKSFDEETGKHRIQYDDAEVEEVDLGKERVEWVGEEAPSRLRRLRRVATVEMEKGSSGEDGGEACEDDDDEWGKGKEEEEEEEDEEEEEEEEVVVKRSRSSRGKGSSSVSVGSSEKGKRKKVDVEKLGVSKKFKFGEDGVLCTTPASNDTKCGVAESK